MSNNTAVLTEPPLYTVRQVADILQATEGVIRGFIRQGILAAVKLNPEAPTGASEWRIPRSALDQWLGPWHPPTAYADSHAAPPPPTEGGLSREALRERAGLPPEPAPRGTTTVNFDDLDQVATDTPSGSVKPTHPDREKREPVRNIGTTRPLQRPLPAPLAPGQADPRRTEHEHVVESTVMPLPSPEPFIYEGEEPAHPIDPSTFGAGPGA